VTEPIRDLGRRTMLAGVSALALTATAKAEALATQPLKEIAHSRGLVFGSEVVTSELKSKDYSDLYFEQCAAMTPGQEAKWDATEPAPGKFTFEALDALLNAAAQRKMLTRLHTLVWSLAMPDWAHKAIYAGSAARILERHIQAVVGHCRGRAYCWDVANEVSDPRWGLGPDGLTHQPWWKALGPSFVPTSFHIAHEADPGAKLFLNDDNLEGAEPDRADKRAIYLRLLTQWKRDGVPISVFGRCIG
jgi:endo-1,4-beta-xylanase